MRTASCARPGGRSSAWRDFRALTLAPLAEEGLDRGRDVLAVGDAGGDHAILAAEGLVQVLLELARAVGALDLPVAELVDARHELVAQERDAALGVARRPVVAV